MPANSLGSVLEVYRTNLDKIITQESCTADLNANQDLLGDYQGHGVINVPSIDMDGLADHTRGGGFVKGGVQITWEPHKLEFERDREFTIDAMDDAEREALVSANVMAEFARTKVVPEVDAIRFARLASNAGNSETADLTTPSATLDAVMVAEEAMQDAGKDLSECILYHVPRVKTLLRQAQPYRIGQGENPNGNFTIFDDMRMKNVPQARFLTVIDLLDGTSSGEEAGGYKKASAGKNINFMVLAPEAAAAIVRHEKLRHWAPDQNQDDDAHKWQYRLYHDLIVMLHKRGLIYVHYATV